MADERENSQNLKEEDENVLLWATLGIGYGIDVFATRIEREIALLRNAGVQSERSLIFLEMILPQMVESSGNFEIPLSVELYQQLCTHLDLDRIEFMGIA